MEVRGQRPRAVTFVDYILNPEIGARELPAAIDRVVFSVCHAGVMNANAEAMLRIAVRGVKRGDPGAHRAACLVYFTMLLYARGFREWAVRSDPDRMVPMVYRVAVAFEAYMRGVYESGRVVAEGSPSAKANPLGCPQVAYPSSDYLVLRLASDLSAGSGTGDHSEWARVLRGPGREHAIQRAVDMLPPFA